jgi:O-antigen/teichoic acid export membrane protein
VIRNLIGHTAAYTFANLVSRGTAVAWLIVLPSFLSVADYGALGLIVTTAALVNLLVPLEVTQGLVRYYPTAELPDKKAFVATAWTFTLLMLVAAGGLALLFSIPLCELLLGDLAYLTAFRIAIATFVLNSIFYFIQSQFRWDFRSRDYTVVTLLFAVFTLVLSIGLAATFADPLTGVLVGQVLGLAVGFVAGVSRLRKTLGLGIDGTKLKILLRFSLPLVPAGLAIFLSNYAGRFILQDLLQLSDVGLFTWASQVASIPALLLLGVQAALTPLVMKHHAEPETRSVIARAFEAIFAVELCLCLGAGLFAPDLIRWLGYDDYAGAGPLVMVLAPALMLLQVYVFAPGFAVGERTDLQLMVSILGAVAAVAFNYLLVGAFGLIGAAFATLGSSALFIGAWFVLSHRLYPTPVRWVRLALFALATAAIAAVGMAVTGSGLADLAIKLGLVALLAAVALTLGLVQVNAIARLLRPSRTPQEHAG